MSYLFVVNPTAKHSKAKEIKKVLEEKIAGHKKHKHLKTDIIMPLTVYELEKNLKSKIINEHFKTVVAVGGDGTIAQVIKMLIDFPDVNVGILPQGTGNILASNLGISNEIDTALEIVFNGKEELMDLGHVDGHPFTIIAGTGVPAEIIKDIKKEDKAMFGIWAYFIKGLEQLYNAKEFDFHLNIDGTEIRTKSIAVFVMNAGNFLGPFPSITPDVKPHDDYLDVCIVSLKSLKEDPIGYFELLLNYLTRNLKQGGAIQSFKAKNIVIQSSPHLKVQADGDIVSTTPTKIGIMPKKLRVLVPSRPKILTPSFDEIIDKIEEMFKIKLPR
ncbi:MAG: diacylglycerol kinase family lipid kinase [Candidatus Melainabacteria bacterium]|nr:diacylglycerol kinase family lipid kinase [Candidatus Melainabacteria bacterium]